jgi:hypothetical protein
MCRMEPQIMVDTEPTTDELFRKHDMALRAFLAQPNPEARSALYESHIGLDKRLRELTGDELVAFAQRYMTQVMSVHSEMGGQTWSLAEIVHGE